MDTKTYAVWWRLHVRVAKGEILNSADQVFYIEGKNQLHSEETSNSRIAELRQIREEISAMEAERERLYEQCQQLRSHVLLLESVLSENTKQALGVGK